MNQFWNEKINEHKTITDSCYFPYNIIDFNELSTISNVNPQFENIKNKISLDNEFIIDDNDKEIESNQINCFPYINSLNIEPKNFSSINIRNYNNLKVYELFSEKLSLKYTSYDPYLNKKKNSKYFFSK